MVERAYPFDRLHKRWNNHLKGDMRAHLIQQPTLGPPMKLLHFEASIVCLKNSPKVAHRECNTEIER